MLIYCRTMDVIQMKLGRILVGILISVLGLIGKGTAQVKEEHCVSLDAETNYFHFFQCDDSEFCCGKIPYQKCCPNLSVGAIFGIVLSLIVMCAVVACSVVSCCLWCHCCPYSRSRARRWNGAAADSKPSYSERKTSKQGVGHPLTLTIPPHDNHAAGDHTDVYQPTETDALRPGATVVSVGPGAHVSVDLYPPLTPLTPETPLSIASPSEFSQLISHDWTRLKQKDEARPPIPSLGLTQKINILGNIDRNTRVLTADIT